MKKGILFFAVTGLILTMQSCGGETKTEPKEESEKACFYSYNSGSSVLEWTAYKFTEKTPVKGTFNEIKIEGIASSDDPKKLIESLTFTIETATVETQNEERNGKIAKLFFTTIGTPQIIGKVKSLGQDGNATVEIKMNNLSQEVMGSYTLIDGKFAFNATIDVMKWNAGSGIKELNTSCKDVHTGADGVSKLWSEVALSFTTELMSDCE